MARSAFSTRAAGRERSLARIVAPVVLMVAGGISNIGALPPQSKFVGLSKTFVEMTPAQLAGQLPELKHLVPTESQDELALLLKQVGAAVADFFDNFLNTACTETVTSIVDTPFDPAVGHYGAKFNYLALVKPGSDKTSLRELRTDSKGHEAQTPTNGVVTIGFVSMTQHFHPDLQADSRFRLLGREVLEGKNTYVLAFAQRPEVARHVTRVQFAKGGMDVFAQGVAWIDPENFRILRLRTDAQLPFLNIGLQKETTEVEYSEVRFQQGGKTFWLPRQVDVTGKLGKFSFRNRHRYSDYRLFLVETEERLKSP